ncbi:DUF6783 domain-containing protein [Robinsoniella sp.]
MNLATTQNVSVFANSPTKCDAQLPESNFKTRSRTYKIFTEFSA